MGQDRRRRPRVFWAAMAAIIWACLASIEAPLTASAQDSLIYTRDIFDPQRGANAQSQEGGVEEQQLLKELRVDGVVIVNGMPRAFIRRLHSSKQQKDQEVVVLNPGDSVAGWTVKSIGEKEVVLQRGSRRVALPVFQPQGAEKRPVGLATPRLTAPKRNTSPSTKGRIIRPANGRVVKPQGSRNPLLMKLLQRLREQENQQQKK